ncbi:MAG: tetratricopeptide repeat protein [Promethearchaeota archaeon]
MTASIGNGVGIRKILARAMLLMEHSNYREAKSALEQALRIDPNDTNILERILICNLELKRPKDALRTLENIVRITPNSRAMWADKGYLHLLLNENREGIEAIQESLSLNPRNGRLWQLLGFAYMGEENWGSALDAFQKSLHFNPESAVIWYNCAVCLFFLDEFEEALYSADQAFAMDPLLEDHSEGWADLLRESADEPLAMEWDPEDYVAS